MIINNVELSLSATNADDVERMEKENKRMLSQIHDLDTKARTTGMSLSDMIRGQCKILRGYFDSLFGAGTADTLGMPANDSGICFIMYQEFIRQWTADCKARKAQFEAINAEHRAAAMPSIAVAQPAAQPSALRVLANPAASPSRADLLREQAAKLLAEADSLGPEL